MTTKKDRFRMAYEYLEYKHIISRQEDLANMMKSTQSNVSGALSGSERILTDRFLRRFHACFPQLFSLEWLLNGNGEMLQERQESPPPPLPPQTSEERIIEVYNNVINDYERRIKELDTIIFETKQLRDDLRDAITRLSTRSTVNKTYNLAVESFPTAAEPQEK